MKLTNNSICGLPRFSLILSSSVAILCVVGIVFAESPLPHSSALLPADNMAAVRKPRK